MMPRLARLTVVLALAGGCANADAVSHTDATGSGSADAGSAAATGHAGHAFVAGGVVAKSASYRLVGTLTTGASTGSSAHYSEVGGVLGTTQK